MSESGCRATRILMMTTIPISAVKLYLPLATELEKKGHEVIFCFADGDDAETISSAGFRVEVVNMRRNPFSFSNFIAVLRLASILRRNNVEVVSTTTPVASFVGRLAAILAGVPVRINTVRGMFPRETHKWQSIIFDIAEMLLHRVTTFTITINEQDMQELLAKEFARPDNIRCVGCGGFGVDFRVFDPHRYDQAFLGRMRAEFGIRDDDFVVTFIGRLTLEKGIEDYVEIMAELLKENDDIRGLVVGDVAQGEHRSVSIPQLNESLRARGIESSVSLTGFRDDISDLMAISDVVVLPSKREGFGMVLAEAAAMEIPVVAYRCRGVEEAVEDGVTGFVIEPGEINNFVVAIQRLRDDGTLQKKMGKAARAEAITRFDKESILQEYVEIYELVIPQNVP